ncbi:hypothetical protein [Alkalihalobacillus sp. AL-G]|uniref:hypothetical protein n=1 Tax=Alkalihalobacillus sp. AL-G TaxID=2926399 RepID=UPI00272C6CF9|nr:hypothetical protein [Alkalihalobacillus sp. AL-G]WLD91596.1 hypothetical protein MOJ78_11110 [Alkalihalobacillus sp. AL-G]
MTIGFAIMIIVSYNLFLYLFSIVLNYRKELLIMEAVCVAMSIGMAVGLVLGSYFGFIFHDDLFLSTLVSIGLGGSLGLVLGLPCSLPASIDGFLSGVMGGMMGAMLGAMLPLDDWSMMLKILFLLQTGLMILMIVYLTKKYIPASSLTPHSFKKLLLFSFVLFVGIAAAIFPTNLTIQQNDHNDPKHEQHP